MKVLQVVAHHQRKWVAVLCLWVLLTAGCAQKDIKAGNIVGTWVERRESTQVAGSRPVARFVFTSNGRFEVSNLPRRFIDGSMPREDLTTAFNGTGNWQLGQSGPYRAVALTFDPGIGSKYGYDVPLLISTEGEISLFFWLGEEAEGRFKFVKELR